MTTRSAPVLAPVLAASALAVALLTGGCTGGSESKAADTKTPVSDESSAIPRTAVDAQKELASINRAIPIYEGAEFRDDLTSRDAVMIRNRYGADASVYTLASDDSFPQVYHYYTTYLAQFRAFPSQDTYPPSRKDWRTLEIQLNQAMQDPFIPGETLDPKGQQVTLQVTETETEPKTVIRYIVTPRPVAPPAPVATAANGVPADPVTR